MTAPIPLAPDILDRFAAALRFAGAPLGEEFDPGLSDTEIDEMTSSLGVVTPPELRTLWRWGMPPEHPETPDSWDANMEFALFPPKELVHATRTVLEDSLAPRDLLAFGGYGLSVLVVETDTESPVCPVLEYMFDDPEAGRIAPSLGALITLWTNQMLARDYWYDADAGWLPEDIPMVRIIEHD